MIHLGTQTAFTGWYRANKREAWKRLVTGPTYTLTMSRLKEALRALPTAPVVDPKVSALVTGDNPPITGLGAQGFPVRGLPAGDVLVCQSGLDPNDPKRQPARPARHA